MGGLLSYLFSWGTPSYDNTPDPGTGLSEYDRHLILETWALMSDKKSIKQNGMEFFLLLFKMYPNTQNLFPDFKNKSPSELRNMGKMKAHVLSVMYSLGSLVENMEDASTLVGLVNKLAVSHISRGVTHADFENLTKVFIAFIQSGLGKQCTPEVERAWTKLLDAQAGLVKQAQDEAGKK